MVLARTGDDSFKIGHVASGSHLECIRHPAVRALVTASVLHLKAYRGLDGRRFAALTLVAVVMLLLSFRLVVHLSPSSTYHIIDLELRMHK